MKEIKRRGSLPIPEQVKEIQGKPGTAAAVPAAAVAVSQLLAFLQMTSRWDDSEQVIGLSTYVSTRAQCCRRRASSISGWRSTAIRARVT